jgi:hypothetical protein
MDDNLNPAKPPDEISLFQIPLNFLLPPAIGFSSRKIDLIKSR